MCILLNALITGSVKQCREVNTFVPLQMSRLERKCPKSSTMLSSVVENLEWRIIQTDWSHLQRSLYLACLGMKWPAEAGWLFGRNVVGGFKHWTFRLKAIVFQPRNTMEKAVLSIFYTDFALSSLLAFHDYRFQYLYSKKNNNNKSEISLISLMLNLVLIQLSSQLKCGKHSKHLL